VVLTPYAVAASPIVGFCVCEPVNGVRRIASFYRLEARTVSRLWVSTTRGTAVVMRPH
jgi:hypothetical protein